MMNVALHIFDKNYSLKSVFFIEIVITAFCGI